MRSTPSRVIVRSNRRLGERALPRASVSWFESKRVLAVSPELSLGALRAIEGELSRLLKVIAA